MDIWQVLGISPTKNKTELKNVYREKLSNVNPEDDPEGFKELRSAYEEAMRLADVDESEQSAAGKENRRCCLQLRRFILIFSQE